MARAVTVTEATTGAAAVTATAEVTEEAAADSLIVIEAPASVAPRAGARGAAPRFFADLVLGELGGQSQLQVRESATGRLVAQDRSVMATGPAALADGRTFVIAEPAGQSCATRL